MHAVEGDCRKTVCGLRFTADLFGYAIQTFMDQIQAGRTADMWPTSLQIYQACQAC